MADRERPKTSWLSLPVYSTEFAKAAIERFDAEQARLKDSKRHDRIKRAWQRIYSRDDHGACDNTQIVRRGPQGEVLELQPNRFARILRDNVNDVRTNPAKFEPQALNSSADAQDQTKIASGVLDWYDRRLHLPVMRTRRVKIMQIAAEVAQHIWFDPLRGREIGVGNSAGDLEMSESETSEGPAHEAGESSSVEAAEERAASRPIVYEGDYVVSVRTPYDFSYDATSPDERKPRWVIVREPMDRYECVKQFVDDEIAAGKRKGVDYEALRAAILDADPWSKRMTDWKYDDDEIKFDDSIAVYHVYGERCSVVPEGRRALVLSAKWVLHEDALVEDRAGVFIQRSEDVVFKNEPHSDSYDGLAINEAYGACISTALSNQDALGLNRVLAARKANVNASDMGYGLTQVEYDHVDPATQVPVPPPTMLDVAPMSGESFTLAGWLKDELDTVMGGSAVKRGDPDATKGDSGSKTAMLYASAQTASGPLITSTLEVDAEIATWLINSLQKRATTPRIITIVGEKNAAIARKFTKDDLGLISLVTVKPANAARDTFEGRMAVVEVLKGVEDPKERDMILAILETGQSDSELEPDEMERMLIERENSALLNPETPDNELPTVNSYDMHQQHIIKHKSELADPEIRRDPLRTRRIMEHCQGHKDALTPDAPTFAGFDTLLLTGQQPLPPRNPPPPMPGAAPGGPQPSAGGPPGPQPPRAPGGPPQKPSGAQPPGRSGMPEMPQQPKNPATGERMNMPVPNGPNVGV